MAVLYDRSVTWGGLVVGTGNKTESLIGYTTLFGDSACGIQPDRRPVQEPDPPAGGRARRARRDRPQGTDRRPVARPDRRDRGRFQLPGARSAAVLADRQAALDRGDGRARLRTRPSSNGSTGWSREPSSSARSRRSPSSGRGRPGSTTSTRGGGRGRRAGDGRGVRRARSGHGDRGVGDGRRAVRGRHPDREPGRRHSPGARGPAGRAAHRRRGHAPHAAPARPPRGRDADDELSRPERRLADDRAARAPPRRRRPRARDRRRDAGRQRPGRRPRGGVGRRGRPGRCRSPGHRRSWPRSWRPAWPDRAGRSRGSCHAAGASGRSGSAGSPPTSAARSCSRRRAGSPRRCAILRRRAAASGPRPSVAS